MSYEFATNYGTYYGNGVESVYSGGQGSSEGRKRQATTSVLNQMTRTNASAYSSYYSAIDELLAEGEIEEAYALMNSIKDEVMSTMDTTNYNYYLTEKNVQSQIENGFMGVTGHSISQAANLDSEFTNEFKKSLGFGIGSLFTSDYSAEESLAMRSGKGKDGISDKAKAKGTVGAVLGAATTGVALGGIGIVALGLSSVAFPVLIGAAVAGGLVGYFRKKLS